MDQLVAFVRENWIGIAMIVAIVVGFPLGAKLIPWKSKAYSETEV